MRLFHISDIIQSSNVNEVIVILTIQQKIMVARDIAGITQEEMASRLGTSPSALSKRISRGKFSDEDFQALAKALGCEYKSGFYFPDGRSVE